MVNDAVADTSLGADWDALAWSAAFASGRAQPRELVARCLGRIERWDEELGICNFVPNPGPLFEQAAASAGRWRDGQPLSPLDGVPFGVKANIAVAGYPFHGGMAAFRERRAGADADCVGRLRAGGMIPLAVFNMHEGALGETTDNPAYRTTANPRNPGRIPGGSSGGSAAAVAAGMAPIALGTDSLGSVRLPSALCGVVGFKPGRDEISLDGVIPLCTRLDHVGVHGRSVTDVMAVMGLLTGERRFLAGSEATTDRPALARWDCGLERLACESVGAAFDRAMAERDVQRCIHWLDVDLSALRRAGLLLCEREAAERFAQPLREQAEGFSTTFRRLLAWGAAQSPEKVQRSERLLKSMSQRLRGDLSDNLLLNPTTAHPAPRRDGEVPATLADWTAPGAIAGVPAISVPMRPLNDGPPLGLQITGLDSAEVLNAARTFFPGVVPCAGG